MRLINTRLLRSSSGRAGLIEMQTGYLFCQILKPALLITVCMKVKIGRVFLLMDNRSVRGADSPDAEFRLC
jgi:hypothetical protein